ncbi:MAG: flagellar export chaperone FliS [Planctomycetota bacterium]
MSYAKAAVEYRRNTILNASPEKLILLMYEGALQHLERARILLQQPGTELTGRIGENLGKAMAIIGELRTALDPERGAEIAANLDRLYEFCLDRIYKANLDRRAETMDAIIEVMKTLKEGWDGIIPA